MSQQDKQNMITVRDAVIKDFFDGRTGAVVLPDDLVRHTLAYLAERRLISYDDATTRRATTEQRSTRTLPGDDVAVSAVYQDFCSTRDDLFGWLKAGELVDLRLSTEDQGDLEVIGFALSPTRHGLCLQSPERPEAIVDIVAAKLVYSHSSNEQVWQFWFGGGDHTMAITPKDLVRTNAH